MLLTALDIFKLVFMALELVAISFMIYILWEIKHGK